MTAISTYVAGREPQSLIALALTTTGDSPADSRVLEVALSILDPITGQVRNQLHEIVRISKKDWFELDLSVRESTGLDYDTIKREGCAVEDVAQRIGMFLHVNGVLRAPFLYLCFDPITDMQFLHKVVPDGVPYPAESLVRYLSARSIGRRKPLEFNFNTQFKALPITEIATPQNVLILGQHLAADNAGVIRPVVRVLRIPMNRCEFMGYHQLPHEHGDSRAGVVMKELVSGYQHLATNLLNVAGET